MRFAKPLLLVAGLTLPACGGSGGWFDEPYWQNTDIVVADIDGDGRADILTIGTYHQHGDRVLGRLVVYRQTAPGVFAAPQATEANVYPWRIALGDLDGDAFPDVVLTYPEDRQVAVLRQDPARPGTFLPELRITLPGPVYGAAVADLDGDGRGDIAVGNNGGDGGIFLLLQDPVVTGQFGAPDRIAVGGAVEFVVAGDLDGDLRADLAFGASTRDAGTLVVEMRVGLLLQQAGGAFAAPEYLAPAVGRYVKGLHLADFDGDDAPDLIVVYGAPPGGGASVISVFVQAGAADFDPPVDTDASDSLVSSFLADLDGNGSPDVGLAHWPAAPGIDRFLHADVGVPLMSGGRLAVTDEDFNGHAAGGPLDADALDDVAAAFGEHVFIARQLSPGVFGAWLPLS